MRSGPGPGWRGAFAALSLAVLTGMPFLKARALLLGIVVLGTAGALYFLSGASGERGYRSVVELTPQIQWLSSQWSTDVARVKSEPLADFDSLITFIPRIERLLEDSDVLLPALDDGSNPDEALKAIRGIAANARREMNALSDIAQRLSCTSAMANGILDRETINLNVCVKEPPRTTRAEQSAIEAKRLAASTDMFASRAVARLLITEVIDNAVFSVRELHKRRAGIIKVDTARSDNAIVNTVVDTSNGIGADRRSKIFAPIYTTRDGAKGFGLALATYIATKYQGEIRVDSLSGRGTVTRVPLPIRPL